MKRFARFMSSLIGAAVYPSSLFLFSMFLIPVAALAAAPKKPAEPPAAFSLANDVENSCRMISTLFREQLHLNPHISGTLVQDPETETEAPGCRVSATCPAPSLKTGALPDEILRRRLPHLGWESLLEYDADGPGTTSFVLRKGRVLCHFQAGAPAWIENGKIHSSSTYSIEVDCMEKIPPPR